MYIHLSLPGRQIEMVNSVFSSSAVYYTATLKLHKELSGNWTNIGNIVFG
jgi:hypothetical protein